MYILAIDQGTTGTTTVLYDHKADMVGKAYREFPQHYPAPGWVEHDPSDIWQTVVETVKEVCRNHPGRIDAVGITNQRETTVLWDRKTGRPLHNAIVWQCRRTADICRELEPYRKTFREKTGLPLDPYFSGTKIKWILDHTSASTQDIAFGTIDTWLIWNLTGGRTHATDYSNASRTLLFNIHERNWDSDLCDLLDVPMSILPEVRKSAAEYGQVTGIEELSGVPILGLAGDQQAALFGQCCFEPGQTKNTYGTGCFMIMNTGNESVASQKGLITTLAAKSDGSPCYALEGSIFVAGAAIQWLRDELKILDNAAASEAAAMSLNDNEGVYFVPAFVGLGAPHWQSDARGTITGLTRGSGPAHFARAALEAMAYQTCDVIAAMEEDTGIKIPELAVDGGAIANNFLAQFQADIINRPVIRPAVIESTSLGAACLAGVTAGIWPDAESMRSSRKTERIFTPHMDDTRRGKLLAGWHNALKKTLA